MNAKINKGLLCTISFIILIIVWACEPLPPDDHNIGEPWDIDGDGISNQVETNTANSHLNLDEKVPNENPSIAQGLPNNGSLMDGLNLRDEGDSLHSYYHFYGTDGIDTDDWGTLALINKIESAARDWYTYTFFNFGIGDMSLRNGGYFFPHSSHQNGLDVDLRYIRKDRAEAPLDVSTDPDDFDQETTAFLMSRLLYSSGDTTNTIFFIDTNYVHITDTIGNRIRHDSGHRNHFHMRIPDPDGTNN